MKQIDGGNTTGWVLRLALVACALCLAACSAPLDKAKATKEVKSLYASTFSTAGLTQAGLKSKIASIQDGQPIAGPISKLFQSSLAKDISASVSQVSFPSSSECKADHLSSPCAQVRFEILDSSGKPLLPHVLQGYAVRSSGRWYVAQATVCGLLALGNDGKQPKGCKANA
jgi:hypothetical protein